LATDQTTLFDDEVEGSVAEVPDTGENIEDLEPLDPDTISQSVVSGTDWTTETIISQINKGNILLNPRFQRRDAWEVERKSRFIESLILGLPIPQLVLAESKTQKGAYIVIDGKQRLLSIRQFASSPNDDVFSPLRLKGLKLRPELGNKSLYNLTHDPNLRAELNSFENQPIRTVVIKNWPNESFLYQVFLRLNNGSVPLSSQELRQALHPGPFVDYADEKSADSLALRNLLKIKKPDFRMRDVELLVRYFAFKNFLNLYRGDLKAFLDTCCENLNKEWFTVEAVVQHQLEQFEEAYAASKDIFGPNQPFRKWLGNRYEARFNRAIFDVIMFYFSDVEIRDLALQRPKLVEAEFQRLCVEDTEFLSSIERTTKSLDATCHRLAKWTQALNKTLFLDLQVPYLDDNHIIR